MARGRGDALLWEDGCCGRGGCCGDGGCCLNWDYWDWVGDFWDLVLVVGVMRCRIAIIVWCNRVHGVHWT